MNIVFTSDDNFIIQVSSAIVSLFENNADEDITVYVLSKNINPKNCDILRRISDEYHQNILIVEIGDVHKYFSCHIDTGGWNDIVLSRLFLDKLLPTDVSRVIYLDGDVIVRHSLKPLWGTDIGDNVLGMVMEPTAPKKRKASLGIPSDGYYYNAGVLLIDLDKWRSENIGMQIVDYYAAHQNALFANDQDAINGCLRERIYPLSFTYNFCNTYYFYPYRAILKMLGGTSFMPKDEYDRIVKDPCIVHYLGEERPWREGNRHVFRDDYIKYYNMTPWGKESENKDGILEYGWKRYFFLWNMFNRCMKLCPMLRLRIINTLIPFMMSIRKRQLQVTNAKS